MTCYPRKKKAYQAMPYMIDEVNYPTTTVLDSAVANIEQQLSTKANTSSLTAKQNTLISGTNIKTLNGQSILGSGDMTISGGGGMTQPQIMARNLGC